VSVGRDLIQGLVNGIKSMIGAAVNAVSNVAGKVVSAAKSFFHIGSPSKLFNQYGRWLDQGLAIGLNHDADVAANASASMAEGVVAAASDMTPTLNPLVMGQTNAGDLLANGFDRAATAVNSVANALNRLDGATAGIGINEQAQLDTSINNSDVNGSSLVGTKFGSNSLSNDNRSSTFTIESGAIQINSTGKEDEDFETLVGKFEDYLISKSEKALS
ncbi:phage tail protein, partial [Lactobacillus apis]|uniref:phage tail protein n=1 Tax=Lactobacillus apis TaxID=303541 RepID=UPI003C6D9A4F